MIRIVLDENTPKRLARMLHRMGVDADPFPDSWKGLSNGRLLDIVEGAGYSILLTCDQKMRSQQNLPGRHLGVVILSTNDRHVVGENAAVIAAGVRIAAPGQFTRLDLDPT